MLLFLFALLVSNCIAQTTYCSSGPTTTVDSNLGAVTLNGDTKSINDDTNCPGFIGPKDLTALVADVQSGKTYTLIYTVTTCGNSFPTLAAAWIDWDQNFLFSDDELIGAYSTAKNAVQVSFQVPPTAKMGTTRMRVQVQETQATTLNPCASFPYGATKDFSIAVGVGTGCRSGPATTADMNLGQVTTRGDTITLNEPSNCPGNVGPVKYNQTVDFVRGSTYSITYQVTTCGDTWPTLSAAWLDYDQNGNFTADEQLFPLVALNGTGQVTQSFTVKNGSVYGNYTLRVQVQESFSWNIDPCADFPYGGTKDFTATLKAQSEDYCRSGPTTVGTTALGAVGLAGDSKVIVNDGGCPGVTGPEDDTDQVADLKIGGAYTLTYSVLNCTSTRNPIVSSAWIDFDQNHVFNNYEQIVVDNVAFGTVSALFKVPISTPSNPVLPGPTRLRVQVQEKNGPPIYPCDAFAVGGTKDFTVDLIA